MIKHQPIATDNDYVSLDGDTYFKIANSHQLPEFFMSLVGAGDHWMFISSAGALTAGRRNPDSALFPYAADDQISAARTHTGSFTLIRRESRIWAPFAERPSGAVRRNLYKTPLGNKLIFEEVNEDFQLTFRYRWTFSRRFGFVRSCRLENHGSQSQTLDVIDGLRNVLPYGVGSEFVMRYSNLANAYKKSELLSNSNLGLYYLSSIPTDRAEPSEGLRATVVWQAGLAPSTTLLSTEQIPMFREGSDLRPETDVRGKPGAYLPHECVELGPQESRRWHVVAELAQDHAGVVALDDLLTSSTDHVVELDEDIQASEQEFLRIVASSDGLQCGQNKRRSNRHLSNTVFNVMRGGVPLKNYDVNRDDFVRHVANFNRQAYERHRARLEDLPNCLSLTELRNQIETYGDADLSRLAMEYLPLAFSRRHGDPTRPWNRFSIELTSSDGSTNLNYQGNWRDIFQNWEALAISFPGFTSAMIARFVNATTADGYNPYRLTKNGFEWEEATPEDPWANIGYWGDHQIIYLLKLLEWSRRLAPLDMDQQLSRSAFTHAHIPYLIKEFEEIKSNPRDTIEFDEAASTNIRERIANIGADGKLLPNRQGEIHYVTLLEKLLTLSLAKLSNFVPDGGIWLNTQRPEWNDANNALVGYGLSMVTACYLHRWFAFLEEWMETTHFAKTAVSREVMVFFAQITDVLRSESTRLANPMDATTRQRLVEELSRAGSHYRTGLYANGLSGETCELTREACLELFRLARQTLQSTIRHNQRFDGLFHSYNLLDWQDDGIHIDHLDEMLEGQVAVLSSGLLTSTEAVQLLDCLRESSLYREDQDSFLLYPNRQLPRFLDKNRLPAESIARNPLVMRLLKAGDTQIVVRDHRGDLHFSGDFRNSDDLRTCLKNLPAEYRDDARQHGSEICDVFEDVFGHRQFTGRSGTFFAYEGLGSIYWHMVSKLGLAVTENYFWALDQHESDTVLEALQSHAQAIRRGIGAEKSPSEYGAFPSDPYSHTPENAGVKQPGMTGQVKEDILVRFAELGVQVEDGCVHFRLNLFDPQERLEAATEFNYVDIDGQIQSIRVPQHGFALTLCQVPITYQPGDVDSITVQFQSDGERTEEGLQLAASLSRSLFQRTGEIRAIIVRFRELLD